MAGFSPKSENWVMVLAGVNEEGAQLNAYHSLGPRPTDDCQANTLEGLGLIGVLQLAKPKNDERRATLWPN